jgi:hypothetical protein
MPTRSRQLDALTARLIEERGITRPHHAREVLRGRSRRRRPPRPTEVFLPGRGWVRTRWVDGRLVPDV